MKKALLVCAVISGLVNFHPSANAAFHLWEINEVFSNSDGTIQFLELSTGSSTEQQLSGHTVVSSEPGASALEFTFDSDLSGSTADRNLLLATERFALLTGVTPDFIIPEGFIPRVEGTINFAEGADVLAIDVGQLPLNGSQSMTGEGQPQSPSPTRFDGTTAALPDQVMPYASIDLTENQLDIPVLEVPGLGVFYLTLEVNFDDLEFQLLDFFQYGAGIGPGNQPASFDGVLNIPSLVFLSDRFEVQLSVVQESPLTFGNVLVLSVTPVPPDPEPEPEPDPLDWQFNEIFSNSDGSIQYIELFSTTADQTAIAGLPLTSSGPDNDMQEFIFPGDLAGDTNGRTLLLATQRFSNLTGLEPDFLIPEGLIPLSTGSLDFGDGLDSLYYTREQLPLNGVQSINGESQPQDPSPTRFDGLSAQVPSQALPFAALNETATILSIPVLEEAGAGIGNFSFSVDLENLQFTLLDSFQYGAGVASGDQPAVLNEQGLLYLPSLVFMTDEYEINLSRLTQEPLVFGNVELLSVAPVPSDPGGNPDPDPEPDPDPLEESIARGKNIYISTCSNCHGIDGDGSFQAPSLAFAKTWPLQQLRSFINSNMPLGNTGACTDNAPSTCATDVANFIVNRLEIGVVVQ